MKTRFIPLFFTLFAAGCIKDPGPEVPVPERPQWLVSKITLVHRSGSANPLPGETPQRFLKQVYEFSYNAQYKLVSRRISEGDGDTLNLQPRGTDSLLYDAKRRVVQADLVLGGVVYSRKRFTYSGSDTLPSSVETWGRRSDTLYKSGTVDYVYRPDTVMEIGLSLHGSLDTTSYIYAGGNFRKVASTLGYEEEIYSQYDNSPALERLMNLQHGLVFRMPMDYVSPPVLSLNNWMGPGPQSWDKSIEYNANLLVGRYVIMEPYPEPNYWTFRVDYFSPDP